VEIIKSKSKLIIIEKPLLNCLKDFLIKNQKGKNKKLKKVNSKKKIYLKLVN